MGAIKIFNPLIKQVVLCLLGLTLFSSCNTRGCTDTDSENYKPSATKDCGCCYYYGKIFIWYNYPFWNNILFGKYSTLKFYLDNQLAGQTNKDLVSYYSSSPQTGGRYSYHVPANEANVIIEDLGTAKEKTFFLAVTTETDKKVFSGYVTFKANTITPVELK